MFSNFSIMCLPMIEKSKINKERKKESEARQMINLYRQRRKIDIHVIVSLDLLILSQQVVNLWIPAVLEAPQLH